MFVIFCFVVGVNVGFWLLVLVLFVSVSNRFSIFVCCKCLIGMDVIMCCSLVFLVVMVEVFCGDELSSF